MDLSWKLAASAAAASLLGTGMILSGAPVATLGIEQAHAGCKHANAKPRQVRPRQARRAVVCIVNKRRSGRGLRGLKPKRPLHRSARRHSRHMRDTGCFSHHCGGGPDLVKRIFRTSYLPCGCSWLVGENIAWGARWRGTPRRIVRAWMHSRGHRKAILNRRFEHVGAGVVWGSPGNRRARAGIYTMNFGLRD